MPGMPTIFPLIDIPKKGGDLRQGYAITFERGKMVLSKGVLSRNFPNHSREVVQMLKGCKMGKTIPLFMFFLFLMPALLFAQEFPTKPVNILVSFFPGSPTDVATRLLASKAEKLLGQPFVVSNNGGGGGSVAVGIVAKEKPDGYHLVTCTSTVLVNFPQFRPVPYRFEDLTAVMQFATSTTGLVVRADSPWKTLKEFVEYAKKNPGKVSYIITGTGAPAHLAMEYIAKKEGIQWTAIPHSGGANVIPLLGGHVTACSVGAGQMIPHIKAGTLRLLATHGERRMKTFPEVPTFQESGYDFIGDAVFMFVTLKGTPLPIVKKLDDVFRKVMDDTEFINYMEKGELEVTYRNSEDINKYLGEAYVRVGKMIRELKIPKEEEKK